MICIGTIFINCLKIFYIHRILYSLTKDNLYVVQFKITINLSFIPFFSEHILKILEVYISKELNMSYK